VSVAANSRSCNPDDGICRIQDGGGVTRPPMTACPDRDGQALLIGPTAKIGPRPGIMKNAEPSKSEGFFAPLGMAE